MWWTGLCGLAPTTTFTSGIAVFSKGLENLNFIITLIHSLSFWLQSSNMNVQPYVCGLLYLLGGSERERERNGIKGDFFLTALQFHVFTGTDYSSVTCEILSQRNFITICLFLFLLNSFECVMNGIRSCDISESIRGTSFIFF